MSDFIVASRYAKSLFGLVVERNVLEEVHGDLLSFLNVVRDNRDLLLMLRNPVITHDRKWNVLKALFGGRVHELTLAILEISTKKNREGILPEVAREFHKLYNLKMGVEKATVITTFPLDDKLREEFKDIVKQITGKEVELVEQIDEEILGGFILRIADRQIDDSLNSRLKALKLQFSKNPYIKEF
jgi:F-type H+-transporting ATPase subunit delta